MDNNVPSPESFIFSDDYICQWDLCLKNFDTPDSLYDHLKSEHVGRKVDKNLCLTCRWDRCDVPAFEKRDHITSHLRVHVPLKPFKCDICSKAFKRPQDLKKHERTHQSGPLGSGDALVPSSTLLQPGSHDHGYQPLTPPSHLDRSPSIPASTISSAHSPYSMPMSPASIADSVDTWSNPGLASPSYSTNSDHYSSPTMQELEASLMNQAFGGPHIDVSGAYYGAFPPTSSGYENMISPLSAKRARDTVDELLFDTMGSFAMETKKKCLHPSYNKDVAGHLDAFVTISEVSELTPDRLLMSLPDVNDMDQINVLHQFCSELYEDVAGQVYVPQTFETLFPEQKQDPITLDASYGVPGFSSYDAAALNYNSNNGHDTSMAYGSESLPWDITGDTGMPMPGVVNMAPARSTVQQPGNALNQYRVIGNVKNSNRVMPEVKVEPKEELLEHRVEVKVQRKYADMSTQTKAKQQLSEGGMMMMQRPEEKKKSSKSRFEGMDPTQIMLNAPAVPETPLLDIEDDELSFDELDQDSDDEAVDADATLESASVTAAPSTVQPSSSSRFGEYVEKARAKQAAAAAAAAVTESTEPLDPLEAMTRQLEQTRLDGSSAKIVTKPGMIKPVTEGDMERQIKAAKARALCAEDPLRKQHAEVVLSLLKSIDTLMAEHRQKIAVYKQSQAAVGSGPVSTSIYPRTSVHVQNQGQIRTVSSYLPRRTTPHQPSPLHQDHSGSDSDYSKLRSNLTEGRPSSTTTTTLTTASLSSAPHKASTDSPVLYPTSDLLPSAEEEPFELSEEERRFIEEDNARTEAARATVSYHV
ncbi:hypothetical protein BGZ98_001323 [Dissophora globulifera]|nr:hypothetical protein BGZ98_001323 [Dissophora globulifera]